MSVVVFGFVWLCVVVFNRLDMSVDAFAFLFMSAAVFRFAIGVRRSLLAVCVCLFPCQSVCEYI